MKMPTCQEIDDTMWQLYGAEMSLQRGNAPMRCMFAMMQYMDEMTHALMK